jgi:nucleoside-diphosphate-sugar epimerase
LVTRFLAEELATTHWFDISAARRDFGYVPQIGLDEGFERVRAALGTPAA